MNSACAGPPRGRADRFPIPGGRPECNLSVRQHRPLASEARDVIAENVPDQPRAVLLGRPFAAPFRFRPFHSSGDSRGRQQ